MTAPTPVKLGPGTLTIGETGTSIDMSCLVEGTTLEWSVDTADDLNVLCGDTVPGARTYTADLTGTAVQDLTEDEGLVAFSWAHKGESVPFTFTPNNTAGATVTGTLTIDPLNVGGDTYGDNMTSDFTWNCVGEPTLAWGSGAASASASMTPASSGSSTSSSSSSSTVPSAA